MTAENIHNFFTNLEGDHYIHENLSVYSEKHDEYYSVTQVFETDNKCVLGFEPEYPLLGLGEVQDLLLNQHTQTQVFVFDGGEFLPAKKIGIETEDDVLSVGDVYITF